MKYVVFDLETIKTIFTACFYDVSTGKKRSFKIYRDLSEFKQFLTFLKALIKGGYTLVGFNSLSFDAQILEFIINEAKGWLAKDIPAEKITYLIWEEAQRIIKMDPADKFELLVPEYKLTHKHIDLFRQKHYDGKAKMGTSLKWIQFSMRYPNVEDMPISHDADVFPDEVDKVLSYNWNDVESTAAFFSKNLFETELRQTLSERFGKDVMNASEPRIAKTIFASFLCDEMNVPYSELKDMRTYRKAIQLKNVIFKYVKFQDPVLKQVLAKVAGAVLNPNSAVFEYVFNYGGVETILALGGIHACCKPGVYSANDEWLIEDIDVVSFYPRLAIVNGIRPKHIGPAFNKVYDMIFQERQKIPKKDPMNYVYKIILNSTYGLSKEVNSYLYDPFFTYSITINGQLSLLMLVERLVEKIPGIKIYQENTDGVSIGYHPQYRDLVASICDDWCALTKLQLEHAFYKKMVIRDVNNYMAIKTDFNWDEYMQFVAMGNKRSDYGKIKHKGTFEIDREYHKNPSFMIVNKAAEAYFFGGIDYREYIRNHDDIYDFCGAVKKKEAFKLNLYKLIDNQQIAVPQQKVTRYYVSTSGGYLVKDYFDGRRMAVVADWNVQPLNHIENPSAHAYEDLELRYYMKATEWLISQVQRNTDQLKLF